MTVSSPVPDRISKDPENVALDWLIDKVMGHDTDYSRHYFHICDGEARSCGCKYQGAV